MSKSMKKRNEWVTKKLKRKIKLGDEGIVDFIQTQKHFFKELNRMIHVHIIVAADIFDLRTRPGAIFAD